MPKLSGHQALQAVPTTSSPGMGSTTYEDLPDMSIDITTGDSDVMILFTGVFDAEIATSYCYIIIEIDGVEVSESERVHRMEAAWALYTVGVTFFKPLSKGSHTIKIKWKTTSGWLESYGLRRSLQVIELKK